METTDKKERPKTWVNEPLDLSKISKGYTSDEELRDTPSRLFRALIRKKGLTVSELTLLIKEYIDWEVTNPDPVKAKLERTTLLGNIRSTYFKNDSLTFTKLLTGLSILQAKKAKITFEVEFENGETVVVEEINKIYNTKNTK